MIRKTDPDERRRLLIALDRALAPEDGKAGEAGEERQLLLEVARRRRGEPFSIDPAGFELVEAVLRSCFGKLRSGPALHQAMSREVARSLCEDPVQKERLEALWARLQEEAA